MSLTCRKHGTLQTCYPSWYRIITWHPIQSARSQQIWVWALRILPITQRHVWRKQHSLKWQIVAGSYSQIALRMGHRRLPRGWSTTHILQWLCVDVCSDKSLSRVVVGDLLLGKISSLNCHHPLFSFYKSKHSGIMVEGKNTPCA